MDDEDWKNYEIAKGMFMEDLYKEASSAITLNDIDKIKDLMFSDTYGILSQDEIERCIFHCAYLLIGNIEDEVVLKYLIFEHQIIESNSLSYVKVHEQYKMDYLESLFAARQLSKDLNLELISNPSTTMKNSKV